MEEYGVFRADSNQMWAVDGKQRLYLEWPNARYVQLHCITNSVNDTTLTFYTPQYYDGLCSSSTHSRVYGVRVQVG